MSEKILKGNHVAFYFIAFFATVALVDTFMVTSALRTHTGLVTDHAYEKGLAYNNVIAAVNQQDQLGWTSTISLSAPDILEFQLADADGATLKTSQATAFFTRPTSPDDDFSVSLQGTKTAITFPASGVWDVRVDAVVGDVPYQAQKRLIVP